MNTRSYLVFRIGVLKLSGGDSAQRESHVAMPRGLFGRSGAMFSKVFTQSVPIISQSRLEGQVWSHHIIKQRQCRADEGPDSIGSCC